MPLITDPNINLSMQSKGQPLKYYSARMCSCIAENSGYPKPECGCILGYWYDDEPELIHGIRTSVEKKYLNQNFGRLFDGGAKFIIPKFHNGKEQEAWLKLAHGDVIVVEGRYRRESDILRRGVRDKLFAFDVGEIISVSKEGKIYKEGEDYTVNGVEIVWQENGESPEINEYYSVEFTCMYQYKAWDTGAKDRGNENTDLPRLINCTIRRYSIEEATAIEEFDHEQKIF